MAMLLAPARANARTMPHMPTSLPALVDLVWDPAGALEVRWPEAPGAARRVVDAAELGRLRGLANSVQSAEVWGPPPNVEPTRRALAEALAALLDGPERALAQRLEVADSRRARLDVVVRATSPERAALAKHPATWMRWELLPLAPVFSSADRAPAALLQLGKAALGAPEKLPHRGLRILFMASSPRGVKPELDYEAEEEALLTALAPAIQKRQVRFRVVEEGSLDDLARVLLQEPWDIVHLSGHGVITADGPRLVQEDAFGDARRVSPEEVLDVLRAAKQMPALVMLANCHTAEVRGATASFAAELVTGGVPQVLGWTRPVRDDHATLAAAVVYAQVGAGKTPLDAAERAREALRQADAKSAAPRHAAGTLHLVCGAASGFVLDDGAAPLSERVGEADVYRMLAGTRMRVLQRGFVGRRRLVQRLLRVVLTGHSAAKDSGRAVAGVCVYGLKGVGKSCAVGRMVERATQQEPELLTVVVHGALDDRSVLEAFEAAALRAKDLEAEALLKRADDAVPRRVRRVMEHWRLRPVVVVLDDFEQNLEPRADGPWQLDPRAAALLPELLAVCSSGRPKLVLTSTAEPAWPAGTEQSLVSEPLGALEEAEVRKLWMRGQAANELSHVSLASWEALAKRMGRNARVLTWARALCARRTDAELARVAESAALNLPVWEPGDEASEKHHAELAALFLRHMAYEQAKAVFPEETLVFLKRARVFDEAVPKEAFAALTEGLAVELGRDLDALASYGLLEVSELDGAKAYRVSTLLEPRLDVPDAARWHEVASGVWEGLAERAEGGLRQERVERAWEHALEAGSVVRADRLAPRIHSAHFSAGLYGQNFVLAEKHLAALPGSPFAHQWAAYAGFTAGQSPTTATTRAKRAVELFVEQYGCEEHADVSSALHALGGVLQAQGDLGGARLALERSQRILAKVLGTEEHPDVAASLHALGGVLQAQGDLGGARLAIERSLAIKAKELGTEEHPDVAASLHALGGVLQAQGDLGGARLAIERSQRILAKELGTEEHPDVAASLHALGGVLQAQGDLGGARLAIERSQRILAKVLGTEEHPSVATSLHELGGVLQAQGDLAGARLALERSLAIKAKVLGTEEHPSVAASLHELGGGASGAGGPGRRAVGARALARDLGEGAGHGGAPLRRRVAARAGGSASGAGGPERRAVGARALARGLGEGAGHGGAPLRRRVAARAGGSAEGAGGPGRRAVGDRALAADPGEGAGHGGAPLRRRVAARAGGSAEGAGGPGRRAVGARALARDQGEGAGHGGAPRRRRVAARAGGSTEGAGGPGRRAVGARALARDQGEGAGHGGAPRRRRVAARAGGSTEGAGGPGRRAVGARALARDQGEGAGHGGAPRRRRVAARAGGPARSNGRPRGGDLALPASRAGHRREMLRDPGPVPLGRNRGLARLRAAPPQP
jgi:hypothetical protein